METEEKINRKIKRIFESDVLTPQMKATLRSYGNSLHNVKPSTKMDYLTRLKKFGEHLKRNGKPRFEDVKDRKIVDLFLSSYKKTETRNTYISTIKTFYKWLGLLNVLGDLKPKNVSTNQNLTPSQLLTPEEVVLLANHMPTEENRVLTLTLYESAARIGEVLDLKIGDVEFSSVRDRENRPSLIATLHFGRSKGGLKKQPVVLSMFAADLKHWLEYHPYKDDQNAYIFFSVRNPKAHIDKSVVWSNLKNAGKKAGIKKKVNPHWLRHSMLSYLANKRNYNEQLLMWRAGWKNTLMAKRYIHSGGEIEKKEYLRRQGFKIEEEEPEPIIKAKPCPHCSRLNPYTHMNCDFCGMPLDPQQYQKEIEKRRKIEAYSKNLERIYEGRLTDEQKTEIRKHVEIISQLPPEHAKIYLTKLLETWTKAFLSNP